MKLLTKPQPTPAAPAAPSLEEAVRQHAEAVAEVRRLRGLLTGVVVTTTTRQVPHQYLSPKGPHGTVEMALMETEHREERAVEPAERLQARHQLPAAEEQLLLAEMAIEAAKVADAAAMHDRVAQALAEGRRIVETDLPALIHETRALQQKWQALQVRLEACDHRAGGQLRFMLAAWPIVMAPGGLFDSLVTYVANGYRLDLE